MNVDEARELMHEWVECASLRGHMEAVAACLGHYALKLAPTESDRWFTCGLLHDFDYEKHPTPEEHPYVGVRLLEQRGVDDEIRTAILGHAPYTGTPRTTPMARALYACDELAGLIVAVCKVRPNGVDDLAPKSVKKKLKERSFAAAVNREEIDLGLEEFAPLANVDQTTHIQNCIDAIRASKSQIGL